MKLLKVSFTDFESVHVNLQMKVESNKIMLDFWEFVHTTKSLTGKIWRQLELKERKGQYHYHMFDTDWIKIKIDITKVTLKS